MSRPVSEFFATRAHNADNAILRLSGGKLSLTGFLGWSIIQLTSTGARTGQPRTTPLVALFQGDRIGLIASSFGRPHNPGWYYNLQAHPECAVEFKGRSAIYSARQTEGDERDKFWQLAVSTYAGYEIYRARAGRTIPVIILEPKDS